MFRPLTFCAALAAICLMLSVQPAAAQPGLANLPSIAPKMDCAALVGADVGAAVGAKTTIDSAQAGQGASGPYCGVRGTIAPNIKFEVRLPATWTQRYLQLGCGGLCGTIGMRTEHANDCAPVISGQVVLASTDMGHSGGAMGDGSFGKDPQLRADFAYRGVHLTSLAAKALVARYYGQAPRYSYFAGCSDGGREALMEAQRFPDDFDGITAGAPAMNFQVQNTFYHAWMAASNTGADGRAILTTPKLPALHKAALASCDAIDGLADGQIDDPRQCRFNPADAQCKPGQAASNDCLTAEEVAVARRLYDGPRDGAGHRFTIGGPQVGSELSWSGVFVPATADGRRMSPDAALQVIKYLAFDGNPPEATTLADFKFDHATFAKLAAMHPLYDATDTNLEPFEKSGGKLILWHGWSDPHISPINTIAYYEGVENLLGADRTRQFARLFLFAGLYHCGGGDGLSDFDVLSPIMAWVEGGKAPDQITAGRAVGGAGGGPGMGPPPGAGPPPGGPPQGGDRGLPDRPPSAPVKVDRTRPVFAYPMVARYDGKGSVDAAASFIAARGTATALPAWEGAGFIAANIKRP